MFFGMSNLSKKVEVNMKKFDFSKSTNLNNLFVGVNFSYFTIIVKDEATRDLLLERFPNLANVTVYNA